MKQGIAILTVLGLLAVPTALEAQAHRHQRQGPPETCPQMGMMQRGMGQPAMMGGAMSHGPAFILRQKEALGLSESQVERLEALQSRLSDSHEAHMERIAPLHERAMSALHADEPDLAGYESALNELAEHHVQMQLEAARTSREALEVLTPEQRSNVRYAMRLMGQMRGMGGGGMMMGPGMRRGMMMGGGPMMGMAGCPMIDSVEPGDQ